MLWAVNGVLPRGGNGAAGIATDELDSRDTKRNPDFEFVFEMARLKRQQIPRRGRNAPCPPDRRGYSLGAERLFTSSACFCSRALTALRMTPRVASRAARYLPPSNICTSTEAAANWLGAIWTP